MRNRAQIIKYVGSERLLSLLFSTVLEIFKSINFFCRTDALAPINLRRTYGLPYADKEMVTSSCPWTFNL